MTMRSRGFATAVDARGCSRRDDGCDLVFFELKRRFGR